MSTYFWPFSVGSNFFSFCYIFPCRAASVQSEVIRMKLHYTLGCGLSNFVTGPEGRRRSREDEEEEQQKRRQIQEEHLTRVIILSPLREHLVI